MLGKFLAVPVAAVAGVVVLLGGCDSEPTQPKPCELVAFEPALAVTGLTVESLAPVLEDAATRVVPVIDDGDDAAEPSLSEALETISARAAAGDLDAACHAFNEAAEALDGLSASAADASLPDLGALRLALGLAHAWIAAQS